MAGPRPATAWYLNGPFGLEQGFEVSERPSCAYQARLRIAIDVSVVSPALGPADTVVLRDDHGHRAMQLNGLYVIDADGQTLEAELGLADGAVVIDVEATEAACPLTVDPIARPPAMPPARPASASSPSSTTTRS